MFNIQSENVQYLRKIINILNKDINNAIKKSDLVQIEMKTKILALTYSAWSEAQYTQILYTPNAFSIDEQKTLLNEKNKFGIGAGWKKLIEISVSKLTAPDDKKSNITIQLENYLDKYIVQQSQIRNKIAHGQWKKALNGKLTSYDVDMTQRLQYLNVVDIMKEFVVHTGLGKIIRDLVQSPKNGFSKNYDEHILQLNKYLDDTKDWDMSSKTARLKY